MEIAIIGLGYVGLPLAVAFAKKYRVRGFDIDSSRIADLQQGVDNTLEVDENELIKVLKTSVDNSGGLTVSSDPASIQSCSVYIVTVPTPITRFKSPDLSPLLSATAMIGGMLKKGDVVVYESTVYPGCTEEDCVPVLEQTSGLRYNLDFFCGYSPERVNPGDKKNRLETIRKVVSGSTPEVAGMLTGLYASIIEAGVFTASSMKVAEASKAIENAQRDVNISFVNELALIFDRMEIDTREVLEAASTKWNFLNFSPGLVGGHCIGVDPYYLLHKAQCLGYHPQVILSGRNVNDSMGHFVASKVVKLMSKKGICIGQSKALILGFSFKENCPDTRNTRIIDIYTELSDFGVTVDVYDPWVLRSKVEEEYGISLLPDLPDLTTYDAIVLAVGHDCFRSVDFQFVKNQETILFDVKGILPRECAHGRL